MNKIKSIQALNQKELENGITPEASWHADYRDTAFVYFGGLPSELSEGDVIVIFSQFGEPVFVKLARDKETGKSRGFGWLKYADQRSTDLAVDNLGGANILGRMLHVDHARYKPHEDDDPEEGKVDWKSMQRMQGKSADTDEEESDEEDDDRKEKEKKRARDRRRPELKEERELAKLMDEHDEDDPMKAFLIEEKKKEIKDARERQDKKSRRDKDSHRERPHRDDRDRHRDRKHRSRRHGSRGADDDRDDRDRAREKREDGKRSDEKRRESPDERHREEEEGARSRDPYAEERERRMRDKERRLEANAPHDKDGPEDRRKRRKNDDDDADSRRQDRDERPRHRERRRSRSRSP
ncbi:unnamed protein product [Parascedosporium putredinis]|uniref:RRM domain-containing protein n=1 Tax=Parascedosporium putredinis TaxID=1442378 RepID=A0A9P1M7K8_9PEZI|nr:unnamed protein product [Parascedosporium putredinis]CAI7988271.1 unnamed protein product [Parascedosporium putredinis]